jgi:hypothetical protein
MRRPRPSAKPRSKPAPKLAPGAKTTISGEDYYWTRVYGDLITRYEQAPATWNVAMVAVRCYTRRFGVENLLEGLQRYGVAVVGERCRNEMVEREKFFDRMITDYPPEDPADAPQGRAEIAEDLQVLDTVAGSLRLLRYLDRLLKRENALNFATANIASPAGLPRAGP